jgi:transposase
MNSQKLICGIDVSKDKLDVYFNDSYGREHSMQISNDAKGHKQLLLLLGSDATFVMESSGPYYLKLAFALCVAGATVRVENPIRVKRFIQMNLERNKNDRKDALWLYRYGIERPGDAWKMPSKQQLQSAQILGSIDLYKRQITMITNQLHSLEQLPVKDIFVANSLCNISAKLEKEVAKLEQALETSLSSWEHEQLKNLSSIPGLGKRAVALLIVHTDGFRKISNYRQLIALTGLAPKEYTSGSSIRGKRGICKMGNGHLRSVLYMCAMTAIKYNKACKDLYQRLKSKGKNGKVALIAVCNKLLKQAFAIATQGTTYSPDYSSLHSKK